MHGNDLRILASGEGQWDEDVSKLQINNPMRRDTFMLRGGGYAILAFYTDNPGVWLLHCHIGWHVSEGLSTSLYVRKDDIKLDAAVGKSIEDGCTAWNKYLTSPSKFKYQKFGSGV
jgi:Multicopper oxidase